MVNVKSQPQVVSLYEKRKHVELTIGTLSDGKIEIIHLGPDGKEKEDQPVYPVASIGKTVIASMLAKEVSEGKIDLRMPLSKYIPGLPAQYYPSLLQLATHHSGYYLQPLTFMDVLKSSMRQNKEDGMFHTNPYHGHTYDKEFRKLLADTKLKEKPYKYQYSNFGFGTLAYIIGQVEREDFYSVADRYIREELGMENAGYGDLDFVGYDKKDQPAQPWSWDHQDMICPAGGLNASMEDLLIFAKKNMDGSLPYLDLCHKQHADGQKDYTQGLAWRLKKDSEISWHDGFAGPFSSMLAINRKKKTAVAMGLNYGMVYMDEAAMALLKRL